LVNTVVMMGLIPSPEDGIEYGINF
jgi:hypothetical protein